MRHVLGIKKDKAQQTSSDALIDDKVTQVPTTPRIPGRFLTDGTLSDSEYQRIAEVATSTGQPMRTVLDRLGLVSQKSWAEATAEEMALPLVSLADFPQPLPTEPRLSVDYMQRVGIAPLEISEDVASFALADPMNDETVKALRMLFGASLQLAVATDRDIEAAFAQSDDEAEQVEAVTALGSGNLDLDRLMELANNAPTIKYLDTLFTAAIEKRATDIHLEVLESGPRTRLRIDGMLIETAAPDPAIYEGVVSRLKILADMDISERRLPQDGRIRQKTGGRTVDYRVASVPTVHGETLVLRLLEAGGQLSRLDQLELSDAVDKRLRAALREPNGLILMTGPTGSGKTTTLHAALGEMNDAGRKIITIENPVEIQTPGLVQIEVNADLGWTFASALRTVLRHDPDVLMVGEIRDAETAELAVRAALTGHLVFSTLHTNRAAEAVVRLRDMGVPDYLLSSIIRLVGAQRLVRTLCDDCAVPVRIDPVSKSGQVYAKLAVHFEELGALETWTPRKAVGCDACNQTGYRGRVALFEALTGKEVRAFADTGKRPSYTMGRDGLKWFAEGHTTMQELIRVFGATSFWV